MAAHSVPIDIYLVPVGSDGYELYCEVDEHAPLPAAREGSALRQRLSRAFQQALAWLEDERRKRHEHASSHVNRTWAQRLRDRMVAWMAERVAEQRLLWHLRTQHAAVARHPDDLTPEQALEIVRGSLRRDARRHLWWALIDACGYLFSLVLTPLPGPNLPAYYFSFRSLGHILSTVGARHGLKRVRWEGVPCSPLTELRACAEMEPDLRDALAHDVATRLALGHLERFVERVAAAGP